MGDKEIIFKVIGWTSYNKNDPLDDDIEDEDDNENQQIISNGSYKVKAYGRTESGDSLTVEIDKFYPYFYIKIPEKWSLANAIILVNHLKEKVTSKSAVNGLKSFEVVDKKDSHGFNADKIFKFLKLVFKDTTSYRSFENYIEYNKINCRALFKNPVKLKLYESNLEALLRFFHVKDIEPCNWIKLKNPKTIPKCSYCKNDYRINMKNVSFYESNSSGKTVILSYDIECKPEDGKSFPDANKQNDSVIQIGSVFSYSGDPKPFYKNVITLRKASKVKGLEDIDIESYDNEARVLLAWTKLVQKTDPDIITGFNINGFDFNYLYKRSKKLGISVQFSKLGRNMNESCKFEEKVLASSALGENILKYYEMPGRIVIDLMKVIQRDHKLGAYSLDYVLSNFFRKDIIMCDVHEKYTILYTEDTYGIKNEDYINIVYVFGYDDSKYNKKLKIESITQLTEDDIKSKYEKNKKIKDYDSYNFKTPKKLYKIKVMEVLPEEIFMSNNCNLWHEHEFKSYKRYIMANSIKEEEEEVSEEDKKKPLIEQAVKDMSKQIKGNKVSWTMAKDDMSPNKMFEYQDGTDEQRGILAKYCIQDCVSVTQLLEKLKIVGNNIGMANVCLVPLNYIFMRGQSIKIFSLVAKKCLKYGYLLPKIKKPYKQAGDDPDEEKETGYEGATVLTPKIGVHYEPIVVLDFASLYPRSMIYMNICMSRIVLDSQYDNLPDYNYKNVVYNNNDGTTTTCRYAEHKSGDKGIYPKILRELLTERSNKKKLMNYVSEQFLKDIYNALQLAYKQTANSLYGQMGASISPIYMKELAASTTATGRRMLEYSKEFMENDLKKLVNYALHNRDEYLAFCEKLFENGNPSKFILKDHGTTNKEEFIEFFYKRVNELLSDEYAIKPTAIYGDSVTPDMPILLLSSDGIVQFKEVKDITDKWSSYEQFKPDIEGLSDKQQNDNISYKVWTDEGWGIIKRVIRHKTNKKIYEVITKQGYVKVTEDHSLLDINGNQIKPKDCKIGTRLLHNREFESFRKIGYDKPKDIVDYYIDKYGYEYYDELNLNFNIKDKKDALMLYYSCKSLGYYVSIEITEQRIYIKSSRIRPDDYDDFDKIIAINDLGYIDDYVYDLETDVGHFHAGVGSMIVKNTDSVFFSPKIYRLDDKTVLTNKQALRVCIEIGILAGYAICAILPEPEELVYEKTLWPLILKKKIGLQHICPIPLRQLRHL